MSDAHDVSKMVGIYKKLFLYLIVITAIGIVFAFLHMPVWITIVLAFAIMAVKGKVVVDAFGHLLTGKMVLIMTFGLTISFFIALLLLPLWNQNGHITGTVDISKELQAMEPIKTHHVEEAKEANGH